MECGKKHPLSWTEIGVRTNFSFLEGASHPEEFIFEAQRLGYRGIAITDRNSLAGVVRAYQAAKDTSLTLLTGALIEFSVNNKVWEILLYPKNIRGYQSLSRLISEGRTHTRQTCFNLSLEKIFTLIKECVGVLYQPSSLAIEGEYSALVQSLHSLFKDEFFLGIARHFSHKEEKVLNYISSLSKKLSVPLVCAQRTSFHDSSRRELFDVLQCIKFKASIEKIGFLLPESRDLALRSLPHIKRVYQDFPEAVQNTETIRTLCKDFTLAQLSYEYPDPFYQTTLSSFEHLSSLVEEGLLSRYNKVIPEQITRKVKEELSLIRELRYEKYFLTCYDIVKFARAKGILCQGRGAAANSIVCFALYITEVDPSEIDLLFARFISKERNEPPDIDIDFEHERREEVIQYIYDKYGREYAALTSEVITYRPRSALREVGKALGFPLEVVDKVAKLSHRWTQYNLPTEELSALKLDPTHSKVKKWFSLSTELLKFPRHLSQHVGGFIISSTPLCEIVPIVPATMTSRSIIEWDKDDIEVLGILKIDILALGMLTCIRKALTIINEQRKVQSLSLVSLGSLPRKDKETFDMISKADTLGVFQIESRAQMSMLPRLRPKTFYDLVIEVAIVRPGPIQGNMVHPYLKRRKGIEYVQFPDQNVRDTLGKTLGVPLFQEQAMKLAITLAQLPPGEAELLRRSMASWKRNEGIIEKFKEKIVQGMRNNGYSTEFAESCMNQIKGFSEYGFPESHAASFALLTYASSWIKQHYPAEFTAGLLNSQPMGFYAPSQIIEDAKRHGVAVLPFSISQSQWDCAVEYHNNSPSLRLGFRLVKGLQEEEVNLLCLKRPSPLQSIEFLWTRIGHFIRRSTLEKLAEVGAFDELHLTYREALWKIKALPLPPYVLHLSETQESLPLLPSESIEEGVLRDYQRVGFSLSAHPIQLLRKSVGEKGLMTIAEFNCTTINNIATFLIGIAIVKQRPHTAKGMVFLTLEDETGLANLIIRPQIFKKYAREIMIGNTFLVHGKSSVGEGIRYLEVDKITSIQSVFSDEHLVVKNYSY